MKQEKQFNVEEIMNSLDGCQRASAPDFFYTRLRARMERETASARPAPWAVRPAYALAGMALILLINVLAVFNRNTNPEENALNLQETDTFQSVAAEYRLNETNSAISFYNLNQDK